MRKTLRVCFLVLALVLTVFGWNQSRAGVCLVVSVESHPSSSKASRCSELK